MKNALRIAALTGSVAAMAAITGPATANHAWSTYHWNTGATKTVTVDIMDNVDSTWDAYLDRAIADWNQSPHINLTKKAGTSDPKRCPIITGQIDVCNASYGQNGWLGLASIALSGGHISGGTSKMNDTYFNNSAYNNYADRQLVMCQEIGHDFGLAHQNENFNTDETDSCMEYTSDSTNNTRPDFHDYDLLAQIYNHTHTSDGGGGTKPCRGRKCGAGKGRVLGYSGTTPNEWGRAVGYDRNGRANVFARTQGEYTILTHVTWVPGFEPGHDDHDH